ncbi:Protein of unknown function [Cotesia congregata]|uniref:Uncharacterized protein n=1 Tax=Cotesia congregata TaxID=51543 RepID=A0A8J2HHL0_COTCN|nr:Protein of unknown function [Cotesia congregata]
MTIIAISISHQLLTIHFPPLIYYSKRQKNKKIKQRIFFGMTRRTDCTINTNHVDSVLPNNYESSRNILTGGDYNRWNYTNGYVNSPAWHVPFRVNSVRNVLAHATPRTLTNRFKIITTCRQQQWDKFPFSEHTCNREKERKSERERFIVSIDAEIAEKKKFQSYHQYLLLKKLSNY